MIAFDTNLVVRMLVADDTAQVAEVRRILEEAGRAGEPCLLTDAVLCETCWVLESHYGASRQDVLSGVQSLAAAPELVFESRPRLRGALDAFETGKGDLSDYLIGFAGRERGARTTFTFDRSLRGHDAFTVLETGR